MQNRGFALRRLHSFLGVLPLGIFLTQHFIINHFITRGPSSFDKAASFMGQLPFRYLLEIGVIFIPLLFHAIYGLKIAFDAKNNVKQYTYYRNWFFLLQRLSGILAFVFIVYHVYQTRVLAMFGKHVDTKMMTDILDNPFMILFYLIGILSVIFHFSNGLMTFAITWGLTVSPQSQKWMNRLATVIFLALSYLGIRIIIQFALLA